MYSSDYELAIRGVRHLLKKKADYESEGGNEELARGCDFGVALIEAAFPQMFLRNICQEENIKVNCYPIQPVPLSSDYAATQEEISGKEAEK